MSAPLTLFGGFEILLGSTQKFLAGKLLISEGRLLLKACKALARAWLQWLFRQSTMPPLDENIGKEVSLNSHYAPPIQGETTPRPSVKDSGPQ